MNTKIVKTFGLNYSTKHFEPVASDLEQDDTSDTTESTNLRPIPPNRGEQRKDTTNSSQRDTTTNNTMRSRQFGFNFNFNDKSGSMRMGGGGNKKSGLFPKTNASTTLNIATRNCCHRGCTDIDKITKLIPDTLNNYGTTWGYWKGDAYYNIFGPTGQIESPRDERCAGEYNADNILIWMFYPSQTWVVLVLEGSVETHTWNKIKLKNAKTNEITELNRSQSYSYMALNANGDPEGGYDTLFFWWNGPGGNPPPYYDTNILNYENMPHPIEFTFEY